MQFIPSRLRHKNGQKVIYQFVNFFVHCFLHIPFIYSLIVYMAKKGTPKTTKRTTNVNKVTSSSRGHYKVIDTSHNAP